MTRLRIFDGDTPYPRGPEFEGDVDADDHHGCLSALRSEVKRRGLGDWTKYRIKAWHKVRGWITHSPR